MLQILDNCSYAELSIEGIPDGFWSGFPDVNGKCVFLKPNLVSPHSRWDSDSTTRVEVTRMVLNKIFQHRPERVIVGECGFKDQWQATITSTNYDQLTEEFPGLEIIALQDGENFHKFTLMRLEKYRSLHGAYLSDYMLNCDVVINIPKMKVHCLAGVTGAIKNMMGTMIRKGSMHPRANRDVLHKRLADLYNLIRPMVQFVVTDGIVGAEYSEQCGLPVESGVLLAGNDMWEVDVAAARLMGYAPEDIAYLRYIRTNFDSVSVPEDLIKHYERPLSWRDKTYETRHFQITVS